LICAAILASTLRSSRFWQEEVNDAEAAAFSPAAPGPPRFAKATRAGDYRVIFGRACDEELHCQAVVFGQERRYLRLVSGQADDFGDHSFSLYGIAV